MPTPVRRRVAALREVQARADEVNRAFVRERAELEAKYAKQLGERRPAVPNRAGEKRSNRVGKRDAAPPTHTHCRLHTTPSRTPQCNTRAPHKRLVSRRRRLAAPHPRAAPLQDERAAVVSGAAAVGDFGIAAPEGAADEPDSGIPDFWLTAMTNHEMVGELVTERDAEVRAGGLDCGGLAGLAVGRRVTLFWRRAEAVCCGGVLQQAATAYTTINTQHHTNNAQHRTTTTLTRPPPPTTTTTTTPSGPLLPDRRPLRAADGRRRRLVPPHVRVPREPALYECHLGEDLLHGGPRRGRAAQVCRLQGARGRGPGGGVVCGCVVVVCSGV